MASSLWTRVAENDEEKQEINNSACADIARKRSAHAKVADLLLKHGADVDQVDNEGRAPLHVAVRSFENTQLVALLLDGGADFALETNDGRNAYDIAVANGDDVVCDLLYSRGARPGTAARANVLVDLLRAIPPEHKWFRSDYFFEIAPCGGTGLPAEIKRRMFMDFGDALRANGAPLAITARRGDVLAGLRDALCHADRTFGLRVTFEGEQSTGDGLRREWVGLIVRELRDLNVLVSRDGGNTVEPNPNAAHDGRERDFFGVGMLIGDALMRGEAVVPFSRPFCRLLLGGDLSVEEDLPEIDRASIQSLLKLRTCDVTDLCLYFTEMPLAAAAAAAAAAAPAAAAAASKKRKAPVELCDGGREKPVTEENKAEYIALQQESLLRRYKDGLTGPTAKVRDGWRASCGGSDRVFRRMCKLLTPDDVRLLVGGKPEIDVAEWKRHCEVEHVPSGSAAESGARVVAWFWDVVGGLAPLQRSQLLQFATGCGRVPLDGFRALSGFNGATCAFRLVVLPYDARNATVTAATCFNTLRIRRYATKAELRRQILVALANARRGGFSERAVGC